MKVKVIVPVKKNQPREGNFLAKTCENHKPGEIIEIDDKEAVELIEKGIVSAVIEKVSKDSIQDVVIVEKQKPGRKKLDDVSK